MQKSRKTGITCAVLAAVCSSFNTPLSKLLLSKEAISPIFSGGLLYFGAAVCAFLLLVFRKCRKNKPRERSLEKQDYPYVVGVGVLNAVGVICTMVGLTLLSAAYAALLSNFEIVVTALVAMFIFKNRISPRLWFGIGLVFVSCVILSFDNTGDYRLSIGALLVLIAPVCWGFANNFTKKIADKDPLKAIMFESFLTFLICLITGRLFHETIPPVGPFLAIVSIGVITYGVSLSFYIYAQRLIGAPITSAFFALAPFLATVISLIIFKKIPHWWYFLALILMIIGVCLSADDSAIRLKKQAKNKENQLIHR